MRNGFSILPHPADVGIEAHGATLARAFEQAALGMMSVIVDLSTVTASTSLAVDVTGSDSEQLLVRWLSEVLYLYDGRRFVCAHCAIEEFEPTRLSARVSGEYLSGHHITRLDVKAVTYHQLSIEEGDSISTVRVYLDI